MKAPPFSAVFYCAVTIAMAVCTCMGIPWTPQILGGLIFLSALPFLWLNERREARMIQLLQKALKLVNHAEADSIEPANEGRVIFIVGPLYPDCKEALTSLRWGVTAPKESLGLRIQVEVFQALQSCSWRRVACPGQRGQWCEGVAEISTEEAWAPSARLGIFNISEDQLFHLDGWVPFEPPNSDRFAEILRGTASSALGGAVAAVSKSAAATAAPITGYAHAIGVMPSVAAAPSEALGLVPPLPVPGERPRIREDGADGSVLYYPRGGGHLMRPAPGDLRVTFLHLPGGSDQTFTAVGVQRGQSLEPFRYRAMAPRGLAIGDLDTGAFNVGDVTDEQAETDDAGSGTPMLEDGKASDGAYRSIWRFQQDDCTWAPFSDEDTVLLERLYKANPDWAGRQAMGPKHWRYKIDFGRMEQVNPKTGKRRALSRVEEDPWTSKLPLSLRVVAFTLKASLEGWRHFLHTAVPELLPCLAPGAHWISTFFLRAHRKEFTLAWRLRFMGFMLMTAGLEVAFWSWQARLALLGGMFLTNALWVVALVGAGGFASLTAATATIYYRPVAGTLYLSIAVVLFCALLGVTRLLIALGCVAGCMTLLVMLFACHIALPF